MDQMHSKGPGRTTVAMQTGRSIRKTFASPEAEPVHQTHDQSVHSALEYLNLEWFDQVCLQGCFGASIINAERASTSFQKVVRLTIHPKRLSYGSFGVLTSLHGYHGLSDGRHDDQNIRECVHSSTVRTA